VSITVLENEFRAMYAHFVNNNELGSSLIRACIKQAVRMFSQYSIRKNRLASLITDPDLNYLALPPDFMMCPSKDLYYAISGQRVFTESVLSLVDYYPESLTGRSPYAGFYGNFHTLLGSTEYPTSVFTVANQGDSMRLSTNDNGNYIVQFYSNLNRTEIIKFYYDGFHTVEDAVGEEPAKNSINEIDRIYLLEFVMGFACLALHRKVLAKRNPSESIADIATEYSNEAFMHFSIAKNELAPLGLRG
jgi:hypothetical protein